MGCFLCFGDSSIKKAERKRIQTNNRNKRGDRAPAKPDIEGEFVDKEEVKDDGIRIDNVKARKFKFDELVAATESFKAEHFLGQGGLGKVYKGHLADTGEIVAIKQLDRNGHQGIKEFLVEVLTLSKADHPNLVKLIGWCAEGDQRLLVYEYMPLGSLEGHLHGSCPNGKHLDWNTRIKIAAAAARGLEYLHDKMQPPVIYRDLNCSNILLGEGYDTKLSDFGLAKVGPIGNETHVCTRIMVTYGYCAPEYARIGELTFKSDIYSFGVALLEIITGRKAFDTRKFAAEREIVDWARPLFDDMKKFCQMADPALGDQYPVRSFRHCIAIAAMCVNQQPNLRPAIADVVTALNYIASQKYEPETAHSLSKYVRILPREEDKKPATSDLNDNTKPEESV